jgi:hypothetical protein
VSRTYLFPSSRNPSVEYETIVHDDGTITCKCPARVKCWHIKEVETRPIIGRSPDAPVPIDDQREILRLLSEGNDEGARTLALSLFPSMCREETETLVQEIFDLQLEGFYDQEPPNDPNDRLDDWPIDPPLDAEDR